MKTLIGKPRIEDTGVFLDIDLVGLPQEIFFEDKRWILKPEFHVTLLTGTSFGPRHSGSLSLMILSSGESDKQAVEKKKAENFARFRNDARMCIDGLEFQIMIEPAFFRVEKDYGDGVIRRSIIVTCFVANSAEFYIRYESISNGRYLGLWYDYTVLHIPHHVTLYTAPNEESRKGVGIYSGADFDKVTNKIFYSSVPPELKIF